MMRKLKCKKGVVSTIEYMIGFVFLIGIIFIGLEVFSHQARISDLQQIANLMSTHISSTGRIDNSTKTYLENIEKTFNMDVDMSVDGNSSNRLLPLETPFTVSITYKKELAFGINKFRKEKTYIAKAVGVTEKYHK